MKLVLILLLLPLLTMAADFRAYIKHSKDMANRSFDICNAQCPTGGEVDDCTKISKNENAWVACAHHLGTRNFGGPVPKCVANLCVDWLMDCRKVCSEEFKNRIKDLSQEVRALKNPKAPVPQVLEYCEKDCYSRTAKCFAKSSLNNPICQRNKISCLTRCHEN